MPIKQDKFFILIVGLIGVSLVYLLGPVLTPFLTALLLAYLFNPLVDKLTIYHVPRMLSVILIFILFFVILIALTLLLVPFIKGQMDAFLTALPDMVDWLQHNVLPWIKDKFGIDEDVLNGANLQSALVKNLDKTGGITNTVVATTVFSGMKLIEWGINLLLIPVVMFYLLCDWHKLLVYLKELIPQRFRATVMHLAKESDEVLSAFLRGQLIVMLALGGIYAVGLTLVGLKTGAVIGMIAGLLSIVPYLGFIVGIAIATLAALMQFDSMLSVGLVVAVFLIGQIIESSILTPLLIGNRIGLHPVAVIFAILAGGSLFGFVGILLALPAAAVLLVWGRFLYKRLG